MIDMNHRTHGVYGLNEVLLATTLVSSKKRLGESIHESDICPASACLVILFCAATYDRVSSQKLSRMTRLLMKVS